MAKRESGRGRPRVVVADDHPDIRRAVADLVGQVADVVALAEDGIQAVEAVRKHRPDAVVMDLRMPVMDGVTATLHISSEFPDVVVVAHGTGSDRELASQAVAAGASVFVPKGGNLVGTLRELL